MGCVESIFNSYSTESLSLLEKYSKTYVINSVFIDDKFFVFYYHGDIIQGEIGNKKVSKIIYGHEIDKVIINESKTEALIIDYEPDFCHIFDFKTKKFHPIKHKLISNQCDWHNNKITCCSDNTFYLYSEDSIETFVLKDYLKDDSLYYIKFGYIIFQNMNKIYIHLLVRQNTLQPICILDLDFTPSWFGVNGKYILTYNNTELRIYLRGEGTYTSIDIPFFDYKNWLMDDKYFYYISFNKLNIYNLNRNKSEKTIKIPNNIIKFEKYYDKLRILTDQLDCFII